jgi:hypothetical protein
METSRRGFLLAALGAALGGCASGLGRSRTVPRWVDVHMHVAGGVARQFGEAVDDAVAEMDAFGVGRAVVFPPPIPRPSAAFDYPAYAPELRRHPGRFGFLGGGGFLNPLLHGAPAANVTPEMRRRFVETATRILDAGAAGFGEMAVLHLSLVPHHPFEEVPADHPLLYALVEVAGAREAVIDLHMDAVVGDSIPTPPALKVPPNPPSLKGNVAGFERLLAHHRGARIAWAHGGSDFTGHMTASLVGRLMDRHPNLHMSLRPVPSDFNGGPHGLGIYNPILTAFGVDADWLALLRRHPDRFVMGADTFFLGESVRAESPLVALGAGNERRLQAAADLLWRLPPDLARRIGVDNAARLYKV